MFVIAYAFFVYVVLRLFVPNLGFRKKPLPDKIPDDLLAVIHQIESESKSNLDFLQKAFEFITKTYTGARMKSVTNFWIAFEEPINHKSGFMPCTSQNYLLRLILIKSGRFTEADTKIKVVPFNFFIHQYLKVRIDNKWIDVDPWSAFLGLPFGKRSFLFG
jgi:hypothetical protein